jgi:fumarate hydratase subunit beta
MDPYALPLLEAGLKGMIGKGSRSMKVRQALQQHKVVYFAVTGGVAALVAGVIKGAEVIAYGDLGAEAVRRLIVTELPAVVVNDVHGGDAYEEGQAKYRRWMIESG